MEAYGLWLVEMSNTLCSLFTNRTHIPHQCLPYSYPYVQHRRICPRPYVVVDDAVRRIFSASLAGSPCRPRAGGAAGHGWNGMDRRPLIVRQFVTHSPGKRKKGGSGESCGLLSSQERHGAGKGSSMIVISCQGGWACETTGASERRRNGTIGRDEMEGEKKGARPAGGAAGRGRRQLLVPAGC